MRVKPLRRPVRAFLLTPIIFILVYGLAFSLPHYFLGQISLRQFATTTLIVFVYGLPIAYFATLFFGVPAYLVLKNTKYEAAWTCILLTAFAACLTNFFLQVDLMPPQKGSSYSYGDSGGEIVIDNVRTAYGWRVLFLGMWLPAFAGASTGLCFWRLYSGKWWGRISS